FPAPIAPMPRPKASPISCHPMRVAPCRPNSTRSTRRLAIRSALSSPSSAAPRFRPRLRSSAIS
ncbi:MAG: hypothetical protein AMXMBFR74_14560, partial [Parvibaculum sp.]